MFAVIYIYILYRKCISKLSRGLIKKRQSMFFLKKRKPGRLNLVLAVQAITFLYRPLRHALRCSFVFVNINCDWLKCITCFISPNYSWCLQKNKHRSPCRMGLLLKIVRIVRKQIFYQSYQAFTGVDESQGISNMECLCLWTFKR